MDAESGYRSVSMTQYIYLLGTGRRWVYKNVCTFTIGGVVHSKGEEKIPNILPSVSSWVFAITVIL